MEIKIRKERILKRFFDTAYLLSTAYAVFRQAQDGYNGSKLSQDMLAHRVAIATCWQFNNNTKRHFYIPADDEWNTHYFAYCGLNEISFRNEEWDEKLDKPFVEDTADLVFEPLYFSTVAVICHHETKDTSTATTTTKNDGMTNKATDRAVSKKLREEKSIMRKNIWARTKTGPQGP